MSTKANITIDQGTDFSVDIKLRNPDGTMYDLTGYTVAAQMRKHYNAMSATTFVATTPAPTTSGIVKLELDNLITADLVPGRYLYDVEITDGSAKIARVIEGVATVTPGITRI